MKNAQPTGITLIPTAIFFAAPVLYWILFGLQTVFSFFSDQFIGPLLMLVLPCLILLSLLVSGIRLLASPRTWTLGFAVVINFLTTAFVLGMTWLIMTFPD